MLLESLIIHLIGITLFASNIVISDIFNLEQVISAFHQIFS